MTNIPPAGLDLSHIPPYQPRSFVTDDINLSDVEQLKSLYHALLAHPITCRDDLDTLITERSELQAVLDQHSSVLYIRMTCQTNDAGRAEAYQHFVTVIIPAIQPLDDELNRKYLDAAAKYPAKNERLEVYNRNIRADVELFRQENVPLIAEEEKLSQQYQTVCGAMMVHFQGQEYTMPQMGKFGFDTDREIREAAFRDTAKRRLQDGDKLDNIFENMLEIRQKLAENADCSDFREYMFRKYHRFDYSPNDCKAFHAAVEKLISPLYASILEKRRNQMQLKTLRPWDYRDVDPLGRPPLKPFAHVDELIKGANEIFNQMDLELGRQFQQMTQLGLLDLESRKGKAPGGYMDNLSEIRHSFIFMNAVGTHNDVVTLLHESGHAFHGLACRDEPLTSYRRQIPMEFCEVASMAMELLGGPYLSVFYSEEDCRRARYDHFCRIVQVLIWVSVVDAFQHWIYENPQHSREQRHAAWKNIYTRFFGDQIDWSDLDEEFKRSWQRQLHIFQVPFYYIEYGIAQLGALGVWLQSLESEREALANYRNALKLGGSKPLPELFAAAGLKFDFSSETIKPLAEKIALEMELD